MRLAAVVDHLAAVAATECHIHSSRSVSLVQRVDVRLRLDATVGAEAASALQLAQVGVYGALDLLQHAAHVITVVVVVVIVVAAAIFAMIVQMTGSDVRQLTQLRNEIAFRCHIRCLFFVSLLFSLLSI